MSDYLASGEFEYDYEDWLLERLDAHDREEGTTADYERPPGEPGSLLTLEPTQEGRLYAVALNLAEAKTSLRLAERILGHVTAGRQW